LQRAPHVAPQVLVLEHVMLQSLPHCTPQFGPLVHAYLHPSPQRALQVLEKLVHVGAQEVAVPQSSEPLHPSPVHAQDEAVHAGPGAPPLEQAKPHASATTAKSARRGDCRGGTIRRIASVEEVSPCPASPLPPEERRLLKP